MARRSYTKIFNKISGLNNKVHAKRAVWDPEEGISDLSASQNFMIDDTGGAYVSPPPVSLDSGSWRCGFSTNEGILAVTGDELHVISLDNGFSSRMLCSGIGRTVDYAQVNDAVYFVSEEKQGRVVSGNFFPWNEPTGYGRDTNRVFSGIFPSRHIGFHLGRIWVSAEEFIAFSEPLGFGLFDLANSIFMVDGQITMIRPVGGGGMFLSTTKKVYFLSGSTPNEFQLIEKDAAPAVEWAVSKEDIHASMLGLESDLKTALWVGRDGVYAGFADGTLRNLTEERVVFPDVANFGAGAVFGSHFIFCLGG